MKSQITLDRCGGHQQACRAVRRLSSDPAAFQQQASSWKLQTVRTVDRATADLL